MLLSIFSLFFGAAILCWVWIVIWAIFIHWKTDTLTRGLFFIVASVFIVIVGRSMLEGTEHKEVLDMLQNVILLISGGVGGNFMAAYLLDKEKS
ncbi:MAG: hypothetical protein LBE81_05280 [Azonexus sp.]|uniref:hypothetical protein n=1 Tax=Azonexus sp. TaxID=1872668 RepID=UPI00282168A4|nr:hypothetical protein [Azonexus sp.]MDR0776033.1 hypothetical protein [Azonexus sp.]